MKLTWARFAREFMTSEGANSRFLSGTSANTSGSILYLYERMNGTPHMKVVGILVVSLRGVNFGFWSHLGCSGQNAIIFSREVSFRLAREKI